MDQEQNSLEQWFPAPLLEAIQYIDRICADDYFSLLCIKLSNVPVKEMMMLKGSRAIIFFGFWWMWF